MSTNPPRSTRQHILDVTAALLECSNIDEVSVREVCQAAEVGAPTIYHHFGDKRGLLEAVAREGFERYLADSRRRASSEEPLQDLRLVWNGHVEFGVSHPAFYGLMFGARTTGPHPASDEVWKILRASVLRLAAVGRLLTTPEQAVLTICAAAVGTTLTLISHPDAAELSDRIREAVFAVVVRQEEALPRQDATHVLRTQAETLLATLNTSAVDTPLTADERAMFLALLELMVCSSSTRPSAAGS